MKIELTKKEPVADGTMAFHFTKPEGFTYQAGQSMDITLIDVPVIDAEGNTRAYSIAAAPHESELMIATRLRNTAFKNFLKEAPLGTSLTMDGPFGSFFLHENVRRPAVFLAGGIGITPFRSMTSDATHRALSHKLVLFYSNREAKDAPFLDELKAFAEANQNLTFVPVMSNTEGYIDDAKIKAHVSLDALPIFYLAGPPQMVLAMRNLLNGMGVSNDDIRFEEFAGY